MNMKPCFICQPSPPWLATAAASVADVYRALEKACEPRQAVICALDADSMRSLEGVFEEFARALCFPNYYGFNSAALEECLTDLSWLSAPAYVLLVTNSRMLLIDEPESEMKWLLSLLQRACAEWSQVISIGEAWDRPAVPFHVVFQVEEASDESLCSQLGVLSSMTVGR